MKKPIFYIVILGTLCVAVGLVAGIGIEKIYTFRNLPQIVKNYLLKNPGSYGILKKAIKVSSKGKLEGSYGGIFKKLNRRLRLSSEQKDKLRMILNEAKQEIDKARTQFRSDIGYIQEKVISRISEILEPKQKEKFNSLVTEFKRKESDRD